MLIPGTLGAVREYTLYRMPVHYREPCTHVYTLVHTYRWFKVAIPLISWYYFGRRDKTEELPCGPVKKSMWTWVEHRKLIHRIVLGTLEQWESNVSNASGIMFLGCFSKSRFFFLCYTQYILTDITKLPHPSFMMHFAVICLTISLIYMRCNNTQ